jgi:tRNA A-37 threonylcarbamoyl transferase component Bud32
MVDRVLAAGRQSWQPMIGWAHPHVIDIGSVVNGKYQLSRMLGDGGMGSVYEARHTMLGTRVAIKVLHPELMRRAGLVDRFLQEARVAAQIRSAHVVQVTDVDRTQDGYAYIVMELLEGEPLSSVLDRQRKLPVPTACEYTLQVLEALEAAHALGVIHRDLKPENVFVTHSGGKPVLKLIDFGIAKARRTDPNQKNLTVAGVVMGTAEYMAPEQARSADRVDARADVYAVGVMLYEMIAGTRPVNGDDARVIALRVERGEAVPLVQAAPDVPREIAGLVHRAMAANPELRFATATDMRLALEKASTARRPPAASQAGGTNPVASSGAVAPAEMAQAAGAPMTSGGKGGTSRMGAVSPAQAATPVPAMADGVEAQGPTTQRAQPLHTALGAPPPGYGAAMAGPPGMGAPPAMGVPPAPYIDPRARSGGGGGGGTGRVLALIALPIVLGAAIVLVLIATGTWTPGASNEPTPPGTSRPTVATVTTQGTSTAPPTQEPMPTAPPYVPTLSPTKTGPVPTAAPRPTGSGRPPPKVADAGAPTTNPGNMPPFGLPPFPSSIPGFPPLFPSGVLPPWEQPPGPGGPNGGQPPPTPTSGGI